jgi:putative transposase
VELAIAEATRLLGGSLLEAVTDAQTGEVTPVVLVTDNGGPFRSFRFAAFIAAHPELRHVRTRVKTPGQNGVRERAFESLKYERLYREDIVDVLDLTSHAEEFRIEFNTIEDLKLRPSGSLTAQGLSSDFSPILICQSATSRNISTFRSMRPTN